MQQVPSIDAKFYAATQVIDEARHVEAYGRLLHDMLFAQVKTPAESKGAWDYYKILGVIPADQAFRPLAEAGCPLVAH